MNTNKIITRSCIKNIDDLENLNSSIHVDLVWSKKNRKRMFYVRSLEKLLNDYNECNVKDKKFEKNRIIWNNLIFDSNYHFMFNNKIFRYTFITKMKLFMKYDKTFYLYIPYMFDIFQKIKKQ